MSQQWSEYAAFPEAVSGNELRLPGLERYPVHEEDLGAEACWAAVSAAGAVAVVVVEHPQHCFHRRIVSPSVEQNRT